VLGWILGLLVAATALESTAGAGAAGERAGLDSGYGSDGIARLGWPRRGLSHYVGARVIAAGRDGSAYAVISGHGRAMLLDLGVTECRGESPPEPKIARIFGGGAGGGR
jgi:hypothetical protein